MDPTPAATDPGFPPIRLPPLDKTLGVLLIATFIGLILLGITLYQAYRYARTFPHDPKSLKILVALAMFLETASSAISMHVCYYYLVTSYFYPEQLELSVWSTNLYPSVAGAAMVVSQSFFARRVWLLEPRYRVIVVLSCVFSLTELGLFIGKLFRFIFAGLLIRQTPAAGTTVQFITNALENKVFLQLLPLSFCLAMAADLLLTASLIHILRRKRTGSKSTDTMIDLIVLYAVNTGLLNGVFDLLTMVFAFVLPHTSIWAAFGISGAKLYALSLLAALHSRTTVRAHGLAALQDSEAVFGVSVSPSGTPHSSVTSNPGAWSLRKSRNWNAHGLPSTTRSTMTESGSDVIELKPVCVTLHGDHSDARAKRLEHGEDAAMRRHSEGPSGILVIA